MVKSVNNLVYSAAILIGSASCSPDAVKDGRRSILTESDPDSAVSFLYAPGTLPGSQLPTIFRFRFQNLDSSSTVEKTGELPPAGGLIRIGSLPPAQRVTVRGDLFKGTYAPSDQTHSCQGTKAITLIPGQDNSIELECFDIVADLGRSPVKVFYKVASAKISLSTHSPSTYIQRRDWTSPSLFVGFDQDGQRVSLRSFGSRIKLHVGGQLTYTTAVDQAATYLGLAQELPVLADGGHLIDAMPQQARLNLKDPILADIDDEIKIAVPFELRTADGSLSVSGTLIEAPWNSEFTVASYNVENLFDQIDDERNATYGDYRINTNQQGQVSNWGQPVELNGQTMSFTDAKILGIEKVLTSLEPSGPSYVNLQEIESKAALEQLFRVMQKHGYVDFRFTEADSETATAVGLGVLSKFPIIESELLPIPRPTPRKAAVPPQDENKQPLRPIFKLTIEPKLGTRLTIFNNHWSSKSHPESYRIVYGKALAESIADLLATNPEADYIITGDFNSEYNESAILKKEHNDSDGKTGINSYLKAQGDELAVANGDLEKRYDLHYELPAERRRTAWYPRTDWGSLDHVILGSNMYDQTGYTYVDNSFAVPHPKTHSMAFLFDKHNHPKNWRGIRVNKKETRHELGGYSDHLPVSFRVYLPKNESRRPIRLENPGTPDLRDQAVN